MFRFLRVAALMVSYPLFTGCSLVVAMLTPDNTLDAKSIQESRSYGYQASMVITNNEVPVNLELLAIKDFILADFTMYEYCQTSDNTECKYIDRIAYSELLKSNTVTEHKNYLETGVGGLFYTACRIFELPSFNIHVIECRRADKDDNLIAKGKYFSSNSSYIELILPYLSGLPLRAMADYLSSTRIQECTRGKSLKTFDYESSSTIDDEEDTKEYLESCSFVSGEYSVDEFANYNGLIFPKMARLSSTIGMNSKTSINDTASINNNARTSDTTSSILPTEPQNFVIAIRGVRSVTPLKNKEIKDKLPRVYADVMKSISKDQSKVTDLEKLIKARDKLKLVSQSFKNNRLI